MVLKRHHHLPRPDRFGKSAHPLLSELRIDPVIDKALLEGFGQMTDSAIVLIIALLLPGSQGMDRMVEIIHPLPVQAIAALVVIRDDLDIIHITLRDKAITLRSEEHTSELQS